MSPLETTQGRDQGVSQDPSTNLEAEVLVFFSGRISQLSGWRVPSLKGDRSPHDLHAS